MLQLKCTNWCGVRDVTALDHPGCLPASSPYIAPILTNGLSHQKALCYAYVTLWASEGLAAIK
jgi:hypothetical protein